MPTYMGTDPDYMQNYSSASLYGKMGIDSALEDNKKTETSEEKATREAYKTGLKTGAQSMSAGGGLGQTLTGTGAGILAGGLAAEGGLTAAAGATGGAALAAGLALSLYESQKQAEAAHERAIAEEAENRKNAVQSAINQQISAARMLSV